MQIFESTKQTTKGQLFKMMHPGKRRRVITKVKSECLLIARATANSVEILKPYKISFYAVLRPFKNRYELKPLYELERTA